MVSETRRTACYSLTALSVLYCAFKQCRFSGISTNVLVLKARKLGSLICGAHSDFLFYALATATKPGNVCFKATAGFGAVWANTMPD